MFEVKVCLNGCMNLLMTVLVNHYILLQTVKCHVMLGSHTHLCESNFMFACLYLSICPRVYLCIYACHLWSQSPCISQTASTSMSLLYPYYSCVYAHICIFCIHVYISTVIYVKYTLIPSCLWFGARQTSGEPRHARSGETSTPKRHVCARGSLLIR